MLLKRLHVLFSLLCCLTVSAQAAEDIVVVAHPSIGIDTLKPDQIAAIYLGRTPTLPNGVPARPIDRGEDDTIRVRFYETLTGKTPAEIKSYWTRLVFSGTRTPPPSVRTTPEVKAMLAKTPGSITYLQAREVDDSVRVLAILK